jgi:hypothetical protein
MEELLKYYKEFYKDLLETSKKEELDKLLIEFENIPEDIQDNLLQKLESFYKPFPLPLYFFSFLKIIKIALILKNKLFSNYNFYFNLYNKLRKKENRTEEENRLLTEVGEILYRMDEIDGNLKKTIPKLINTIQKQIQKSNNTESIFLKKVTDENYEELYPIYEELIQIILNTLDELKLEKGLYKLSQFIIEQTNIKID